jgi:hypothetical protein
MTNSVDLLILIVFAFGILLGYWAVGFLVSVFDSYGTIIKGAKMKSYVTTFTVNGNGEFPMDMLRYDSCHPVGSDDASRIVRSIHRYVDDNVPTEPDRSPIKLRHIGDKGWRPTAGRWSSFLWGVDPLSITVEEKR